MRPIHILLLTLLLVILVSCLGPPVEPLSYTVEATSTTTVMITFDRAVSGGTETVANYRIEAADGSSLEVVTAYQRDTITVLLGTAPQVIGADYTLTLENIRATDSGSPSEATTNFVGTSETAPILASAIALNPTEILLTFGSPTSNTAAVMGDSALDIAHYDIVEENPTLDETPDLTIESARFGIGSDGKIDRGRVILTTETQKDTLYTLRAVNLVANPGDKLLDPWFSTAEFRGMPVDDTVPPEVVSATSIDNTHVLIDFSEPVVGADRADRYLIEDDLGDELEVLEADYANPYKTQVLLTTAPQQDERVIYTVTVTGVTDRQGNTVESSGQNTAQFQGTFRTGPIDGDNDPPRVSNTGSTGNTEVLVTFTEPIEAALAENPDHYRITASIAEGRIRTQATLTVLAAELSQSRTTVTLTTMSQSDLNYTLEVTNITDLAGNQIAPPDRFHDPSALTFKGTPPDGPQVDSDCDGLSDAAEQRGWVVTVANADGTTSRSEVTSDPGDPGATCADNAASQDTDGDGLGDLDERIYRVDPRSADTDGDGISDNDELNFYYSEPAVQDTDGDGLVDGLETDFFGTSPLLADTDGDQLLDGDEVVTQNRNPLIADLPAFDIQVVGDVQLDLDVRFTATSESGSRFLETRSSSTSLSTSSSRTQGSESSKSTEWFINAGAKVGFTLNSKLEWGFSAEFGVDGGYKEGTTTSFSSESVRSTQQEQARSLSTDRETNVGESVTREVVDATMAIAVEIENLGDIAFTLENLELTAKVVDPRDPTRFVPIATLVGTASRITLGPAPDARGPFRFIADNPPPALIEQLRENPSNLMFEVANYDVVDEFGRNFSYTYQDVNDRTATLLIDYAGRLPEEVNRVATHSGFDPAGDALGVTMQTVLEGILGLEFVPEADDVALIACFLAVPKTCTAEQLARIRSSYSTRTDAGITRLARIRTVVDDPSNGYLWFVTVDLAPGAVPPTDFNDVVTTSSTFFRFLFGQDLDGDGMTVQQEAFYGSLDSEVDVLKNACFGDPTQSGCDSSDGIPDSRDTDKDGISDDQEVFGMKTVLDDYDPWLVIVQGQDAYTTSSSPSRYDTDADGLTDCQELGLCDIFVYIYPNASTDTPGAGQAALRTALAADRQNGTVTDLFRDAFGRPTRHPTILPAAWIITRSDATDPSSFDTDADFLSDLGEVRGVRYLPLDAALADNPVQLFPGILDPEFATDPLDPDSDGDILGDGLEVQIGVDPTNPSSTADAAFDNDGDGLRNIEEEVGWVVVFRNAAGDWVDSTGAMLKMDVDQNPLDAAGDPIPLDARGNPVDYPALVLDIGGTPARVPSDKNDADSDNDGLDDAQERDLHTNPTKRDTDGDGIPDGDEIAGVDFPPDAASPVRFTNELSYDSDRDGRSDGDEANDPWVVSVSGAEPYETYSDPLKSDADFDGLGDLLERLNLTDPNRVDTDGDGISDFDEVNSTYARNPLIPDQVIEFRYSNATLLDSCYQIGGEATLKGWSASSNGWFSDLRYSRFGGSGDSGGYTWILSSSLFFGSPSFLSLTAPAEFLGDKSAYYNGTFSFDLREFLEGGDQTRFDPDVRLTGDGLTIEYDNPQHESTSWTTVSVPLSETGWTKVSDGTSVSTTEFQDVLGDLTSVVIRGAYESPESFWDTLLAGVGFDNPTMEVETPADPSVTLIRNDFNDGQLAAGNFQGQFKTETPTALGALEVMSRVSAGAILSGEAAGSSHDLMDTPIAFVVGREQGFRVFSTNIFEESEAYTLGIDPTDLANYGNFSSSYDYPIVGGSAVATLRGETPDQTDTCELSVSWTWRVLE